MKNNEGDKMDSEREGTTDIDFTTQQKKAIDHDNGFLRIIACAGSGKTEVISRRIATLIQKGADPKEIVAFTFTEKAADELKSRIRGILDKESPSKADFGDMYIGTIHSFCFHMLQELNPKYKNFDVLDPAKRVAYISKKYIFRELDLWPFMYYGKTKRKDGKPNLNYYTVINRFIESIDTIMMEDMDIDSIIDDHNKDRLKNSYIKYNELLEKDHYLDFSSMIYRLVKLLESDSEVLRELNNKIKHLVVDEYQDVNIIQEKLIEFISRGTDSLCVVGDDDQCIYYWNGAFVDNILEFNERYDEITDIPLDVNFRSTEAVIFTAREFIRNNEKRLTIKNMVCSENLEREFETGDIIYHHLDHEKNEHEFILDKIKLLLGTDFIDKRNNAYSLSEGDFAVLARTNEDAANIVEYLSSENMECIAYSGGSIFERGEVLLAMDCLAFLFRCKTYGYIPTPSLEHLKAKYSEIFCTKYPEADVDYFYNAIIDLKKFVDKIFEKEKDYLGELGLQEIYHQILNCLGAQHFEFTESFNYNLAVLSTAISDYESVWRRLRASEVDGFFQFAKAYGESNYVNSKFSDVSKINAVKVLTIHKSKGLEFPVVFLPGMVKKQRRRIKKNFINESVYDFDRYFGDDEDERRVFYTALTRSEKYLFITSTDWKFNEKKRPYNSHPFIDELDWEYISNDIEIERANSGYEPRLYHQALFPTSFSELTTFDRCPYDFLIRHVYGYNAGVPVAFGYGTNIHNILNVIHKNYIKNGKIPDEDEIDEIFEDMFSLRYATPIMSENMKKGAKKVVKNYVDVQQDEFHRILETEKRFEFVIDDALISGQIDLLKKVDEKGNVTEVEIIDFKTEGNTERLYQLDYEKQLKLYAVACLESLGLNPQKAFVHHLDDNSLSEVDISNEKLVLTKEEVIRSVNKILSKDFVPCPSKNCEECDYRLICSKKGFIT